jgi:hypothetical protein
MRLFRWQAGNDQISNGVSTGVAVLVAGARTAMRLGLHWRGPRRSRALPSAH